MSVIVYTSNQLSSYNSSERLLDYELRNNTFHKGSSHKIYHQELWNIFTDYCKNK